MKKIGKKNPIYWQDDDKTKKMIKSKKVPSNEQKIKRESDKKTSFSQLKYKNNNNKKQKRNPFY